jgi:uncharacterized protein DUF6194
MATSDGPDAATITRYVTETYPDTIVTQAMGGMFFSCNEQSWPNFATIATTDEFDDASDLGRDGVFRLNIGVTGWTFDRHIDPTAQPDYTELDRVLPHPVYAAQHWLSILNPSSASFETIVKPLLDEAHGIVSSREARIREGRARASDGATEG